VGKNKIGKIFHIFFGNRGKSETGGNASLPQGGDERPCSNDALHEDVHQRMTFITARQREVTRSQVLE